MHLSKLSKTLVLTGLLALAGAASAQKTQLLVFWPEIMSPLTDTMCLINRNQTKLKRRQKPLKFWVHHPLRGNV